MNVPRMTRQARFSRLRDSSAARPKPPNDYEGSSPNAGLGYTGRRMPSLRMRAWSVVRFMPSRVAAPLGPAMRSEEHTSELQSHSDLVCRLLLEKKKKKKMKNQKIEKMSK